MALFLRITVILFEILYYSLFMKFARKDGSFIKYLTLYIFISIVLFFITSFNIFAYLIFILLSTFGLKIFSKTTLYDMFITFIMLIVKLMIELVFAFLLVSIIPDITICKVLLGVIKAVFVIIFGNNINKLYQKCKNTWDNNNFYIRYLFSTFMFIYIISACLFLIRFR